MAPAFVTYVALRWIFHHLDHCRGFSVFSQSGGVGPVLVDSTWGLQADLEPHPLPG